MAKRIATETNGVRSRPKPDGRPELRSVISVAFPTAARYKQIVIEQRPWITGATLRSFPRGLSRMTLATLGAGSCERGLEKSLHNRNHLRLGERFVKRFARRSGEVDPRREIR